MKVLLAVVSLAACGGGGGFPTDSQPDNMPVIGGRFELAWSITDVAANPIPCAQIGATFVTVTLRNRAVQGASTEVFSCSSGTATSLLTFTPGLYDLSFVLGGNSVLIGTAPAVQGVEITSGGTVTINPITFAVDATGKFETFLNTGVAGGNCAAGANVTDFTITLTHSGAACEPATFAISNGPPSTYTVDCATPALSACIDNNQELSIASLPSGSYRIAVKGKVSGIDCWTNTSTLIIPPNGKTLMQTLGLTKLTTAGCPP